jgi:hypothetical protein
MEDPYPASFGNRILHPGTQRIRFRRQKRKREEVTGDWRYLRNKREEVTGDWKYLRNKREEVTGVWRYLRNKRFIIWMIT